MSDPLTPEERSRLRSKFDKNLDAGLVEPITHRDIVRLLAERDRLEQERDEDRREWALERAWPSRWADDWEDHEHVAEARRELVEKYGEDEAARLFPAAHPAEEPEEPA